jgi:hypothetical protein
LTPATAANSTATAVAAEVEATAADIKSGPGSGKNALPLFVSFFSFCIPYIFCFFDQKTFIVFYSYQFKSKDSQAFIHHFPMLTEARRIQTITKQLSF